MDSKLRHLNYLQYNNYNTSQFLSKPLYKSKISHELYPYHKMVNDIIVEIELQKHLHQGVKENIYIDNMINNAKNVNISNINLLILNDEDTLLEMIENTFENGTVSFNLRNGNVKLRDYLDLLLYTKKINFSTKKIISIIDYYKLYDAAKFVFENLYHIFSNEKWISDLLDLLSKQSKYNCDNEINFYTKIFNSEIYKQKFLIDFKNEIYTLDNKDNSSLIDSNKEYLDISLEEYKFKYSLKFNNENIFCILKIHEDVVNNIDNVLIEIRIFNNNINSDICAIGIDIIKENGNKYYYFNTGYYDPDNLINNIKRGLMNKNKKELIPIIKKDKINEFDFTLNIFEYEFDNNKNILASEVLIFEKQDKNIYYLRKSNCSLKKDMPVFIC